MKTIITILATLVFAANAFATGGQILEREMWGVAGGDKETLQKAQEKLIEELQAECGPVETSAIDIIEASDNHTAVMDEVGNFTYNYGVKVKVYCM